MIIPRYSNPHFLPGTTRRVARQEICADSEDEFGRESQENVETIEFLNEVIRQSLHVPDGLQVDTRGRKRRKIDQQSYSTVGAEEPIRT